MTMRCSEICISRRSALLVGMTAALTACAVGPIPVAQSASDPSSPSAPEGTNPAPASGATPKENPSHAQHSEHAQPQQHDHDQQQGGVVYVCPMHPEVQSAKPGTCPKCNMKLEPKK